MPSIELLAEVDRDAYRKAARLRGLEIVRYRPIKRSMIAPTARHSFGPSRLAFAVLKRLRKEFSRLIEHWLCSTTPVRSVSRHRKTQA